MLALRSRYDKDDDEDRGGESKRQAEELRRRKAELEASYTKLFCVACSHFVLKLTVGVGELPKRGTDGSRVIGENQLVSLDCAKGPSKAIKREKGVERQYWWVLHRAHCVRPLVGCGPYRRCTGNQAQLCPLRRDRWLSIDTLRHPRKICVRD
jgi:hypothetical protein